jgi:hypothetical protein
LRNFVMALDYPADRRPRRQPTKVNFLEAPR